MSSVVRSEETYSTDLPENFIDLSSDVQAVILEYVFFSEKANQVWGDDYQESSVHLLSVDSTVR